MHMYSVQHTYAFAVHYYMQFNCCGVDKKVEGK
jgi:hypothetical protein